MTAASIIIGWSLVTLGIAWGTGAWVPVWSISSGLLVLLGYSVPRFLADVKEARQAAELAAKKEKGSLRPSSRTPSSAGGARTYPPGYSPPPVLRVRRPSATPPPPARR